MHENFESYKNELDRLRLTDESKKALTESLSRRKMAKRPQSFWLKTSVGRIAAVAAVVCLLTGLGVVAVATVTGDPTLGNTFSGDQAGYDQSSGVIGRAVEKDGWMITITDCVGDDFQAYLGVEVEAPEGIVLDGTGYEMYMDNEYNKDFSGSSKGFLRVLPDDDPTDNKVRLLYDWYFSSGSINHLNMRVKLVDFIENHGYLEDEHNWDREIIQAGEWDFGWISIDFADTIIRLSPMLEIPGIEASNGGALVLDEIAVSPLGVYLQTNDPGPYPQEQVSQWGDEVASTLHALDTDGNEILLYADNFMGVGSSYYSFTEYVDYQKGPAQLNLVDLEKISAVSVAGITIPVR